MKISKESIAHLKHLSTINQNIVFRPGNTLSTVSPQKNFYSRVIVPETFESVFGIYDLSEFLGAMSLFSDPELTFKDKYVLISENGNSIKYFEADTSILISPTNEPKFPESIIDFKLPAETLSLILRTAGVLRTSDVSLVGDGSSLAFEVSDLKSSTANSFNLPLGDTDLTFRANFKTDNLKLVPGEYMVNISAKKISRFINTAIDSVSYAALESTSTFTS